MSQIMDKLGNLVSSFIGSIIDPIAGVLKMFMDVRLLVIISAFGVFIFIAWRSWKKEQENPFR